MQEDAGGASDTGKMSEILGCVLTLNPGRESSLLLSDRCMAKMKKGTCHRARLCRSVSLDTLSSNRDLTQGRRRRILGCTGELGLVPKEYLRRMRRGDRSPAHRAAPVS